VDITTEHGQDVQTFIDDQQGQIIIVTVAVEGATGQHLRNKNASWLFIADLKGLSTTPLLPVLQITQLSKMI
jgi:hypothetical protein